MKNFKRILAVVLAVLCVVPAMVIGASAETTLADYWYAAGKNVVSALDEALAPYDNTVSLTANEDGSVSVRDVAVEFQGAYSNDPITAVSTTYPMALNGASATIVPVGTDVDGDGEAEYAYSYSFFFTNGLNAYDEGQMYCKGNGFPNYNGFYTGTTAAGEYTYGVALSDNMSPIPWSPDYFAQNVDNNGAAEYCVMTIINSGNYWTADTMPLDMPVDLSQKISVEVFSNTDLDEDGVVDLGVILNGHDEEAVQYVFGTCADCYANFDAADAFYLTLGASANGVNTHTASFDIVEVGGETDVANFSSTFCKADAHEWSEPVVTEATCTEDGTSTIVCATCNLVDVEVVAEATGHAYVESTVAPTCEETGLKTNTCDTCGDVVEEEIAALGHNYSVKHWISIPTAEAAGTARVCCAACGQISAELVEVEATLEAFWTVGAKNDMSVFNEGFASLSDTAHLVENEDGTLSVLDASNYYDNGAWNNNAITAASTNFKTSLNGSSVEIEPIGYDVDGDGEDEYASSYSIYFTNGANPAYASGKSYAKGYAYPNNNGFYTGTTAAGEYTYGVAICDNVADPSWVPGFFANNVNDNGYAEYCSMTIINNGNYWTCDTIPLDVPVFLGDKLSVEIFSNFDLDEDGVVDLGVILNGHDEEAVQYVFGTCADCYADYDGEGKFQIVLGASANGVNTHNTSFKINSINGEAPATFAGDGASIIVPTIAVENDDLVVDNGAHVKDVMIITGTGYESYADVKAAKYDADFYYRATYLKFEGASHKYVMDLASFETYTVLVRTIDGTEYLQVIETGNTNPEACDPQLNDSGRVKFVFDKEVKVLRLAPVAGLRTVAAIKAADGYKAIKAANFTAIDPESNGSELRYFPGSGTYSYVVEYTDGVKEFGEFTIDDSLWTGDNAPAFAADGITNMRQNRFIKAYYAPGNWNTVKEIKAVDGYRVILKDYTVRDTELVETEVVDEMTGEVTIVTETKNLSTRHYNFKAPLSGEYTFAIVWGNAVAPATIYHVTF